MEEMLKLGCTDQEGAQWAVTNVVWNLCGKGAFRGAQHHGSTLWTRKNSNLVRPWKP